MVAMCVCVLVCKVIRAKTAVQDDKIRTKSLPPAEFDSRFSEYSNLDAVAVVVVLILYILQ